MFKTILFFSLLILSILLSDSRYSLFLQSALIVVTTLFWFEKAEQNKYKYFPIFLLMGLFLIVFAITYFKTGFSGHNWLTISFFPIVILLSVIMGLLLSIYKSSWSKILILIVFGLFLWGVKLILPLINQQQNFGNLTAHYDKAIEFNQYSAYDPAVNNNISLAHNPTTEIYVIDFWQNYCAPCIKDMPVYNKLKNKYANNPKVKFISLLVYKKNEKRESVIATANEIIKDYDLKVKPLYIVRDSIKDFDIKGYPTVCVVKNNRIIFKGNIDVLDLFEQRYLR